MDEKNNIGKENSGDWNSGDWNSGDWNSGDWNSGDRNSGYKNSGDRNSGYGNSGDGNSGDWNSGDCNSGDWNSGYKNSGDCNSGDCNSGDCNSGYFNIDEPKVRIFGKETDIKRTDIIFPKWFYFYLTEWILEKDMSPEEKQANPGYITAEGYLKTYEYKQAWRKSFDKASKEDIAKALDLPNFDYGIFEDITGISKQDFDNRLGKCTHLEGNNFCPTCGKKLKE